MLKLCAQTATSPFRGETDYTWCWKKATLIVASLKSWWCDSLNFSTKGASLLVTKLLPSATPGSCTWFLRWSEKDFFFFLMDPVINSGCTGGGKWNVAWDSPTGELGEGSLSGKGARNPSCHLSCPDGDAWIGWQETGVCLCVRPPPAWGHTDLFNFWTG